MSTDGGQAVDVNEKHECGYCGASANEICTECKNMRYCSHEHQIADQRFHKLLCKTYADFQERPGEWFCRAISFPGDAEKPYFVWIPTQTDADSSNDGEEVEETFSDGEQGEQKEMSSIFEHGYYDREEMGWEDARADPTGLEEPDPMFFDEWSDTSSTSTAATSFEQEAEPSQGSVSLRWCGSFANPGETLPNKCVAYLTNDQTAMYLRGPLLLYGLDDATGSRVDLDTTVLTLAIRQFPTCDQDHRSDCGLGVGEVAIFEAAGMVKELGDAIVDGQDVSDDTVLAGSTMETT